MNDLSIKPLGDVIELKYGKPISPKYRDPNGENFIYGANGILGKTSKYLINEDAIIVGRKGSAGQVNRVSGKFWPSDVTYYVLGNKRANVDYIYFLFRFLNLSKLAKGVKPGLNRNDVYEIKAPIPSLVEQERIAENLHRADILLKKRKHVISLLNKYIRSSFLDMFGDPVVNSKDWDKKTLKFFGKIITGNTPPRNDFDNYSSNYIEWIKTDNIVTDNTYLTTATEYLSEKGLSKSRFVDRGAVLVACIAGSIESIGRVAISDRKVSFNQQINAIQPNEKINSFFLYWLIKISKPYIQNHASKGMKKILTKGEFEKIVMIMPPIDLQNKFADVALNIETIKQKMLTQSIGLEELLQSLMQKSFSFA